MTNDTQDHARPPSPEQVLIARLVLVEARRLLTIEHGPTARMIERAVRVTDLADRWWQPLWPDQPTWSSVELPVVMFEDVEALPRTWRPSRVAVMAAVASLAETITTGVFPAAIYGRDVRCVGDTVRAYAASLDMARVFSGIDLLLPERLHCRRCGRRTVERGRDREADACSVCGRHWGE